MSNIIMSNEAYGEFKTFLKENNVEDYSIRINIIDYTCHGPIFNIMVDKPTENDIVEVVNEITFMVEKEIISEFGGFEIVSDAENEGNGIGLKPIVMPQSSCGSCGGGCGGDDGCSGCN